MFLTVTKHEVYYPRSPHLPRLSHFRIKTNRRCALQPRLGILTDTQDQQLNTTSNDTLSSTQ